MSNDNLKPDFMMLAQDPDGCTGCANNTVHTVPARRALTGQSCTETKCEGSIIVHRSQALARSTDPDTSHAAAAAILPKRASIASHIMVTLATPNPADAGGYAWTGTEIAAKNHGLRLNSITPRFKELVAAGKIKATSTRRDGQIAWVLNA
jgi:hypothetical protein